MQYEERVRALQSGANAIGLAAEGLNNVLQEFKNEQHLVSYDLGEAGFNPRNPQHQRMNSDFMPVGSGLVNQSGLPQLSRDNITSKVENISRLESIDGASPVKNTRLFASHDFSGMRQ